MKEVKALDPRNVVRAAQILRDIFVAFSETIDSAKGKTYRKLKKDLAANADSLILSGQITLPQIIDTLQKLEEYCGTGDAENLGDDPTESLYKWLNGEDPGSDFDTVPASAPVKASKEAR